MAKRTRQSDKRTPHERFRAATGHDLPTFTVAEERELDELLEAAEAEAERFYRQAA